MGLWQRDGSPNLGKKTRPNNNQRKKRIYKIVDFAVPAVHRIKLKECEKKDKYLDLVREFKKTMEKVKTIIRIVTGAFGTVTRTWMLADEWTPSKLLHYCERPEYWEESWKLEETCSLSNSTEIPSANADQ